MDDGGIDGQMDVKTWADERDEMGGFIDIGSGRQRFGCNPPLRMIVFFVSLCLCGEKNWNRPSQHTP